MSGKADGISREDVRLRSSEDGPILDVNGMEILLRPFLEYHHTKQPYEDYECTVENDVDGSWWTLQSGIDGVPDIVIEPQMSATDGGRDS